MRIVVQRVRHASVIVHEQIIGQIDRGLLLLIGFGSHDTHLDFPTIAQRICDLRIFPDIHSGKLEHSVLDVHGGVLAVPQFSLYGETSKGRRPSFRLAMPSTPARTHFEQFIHAMQATNLQRLETGQFGADMQVSLLNDGPMTLILEY